ENGGQDKAVVPGNAKHDYSQWNSGAEVQSHECEGLNERARTYSDVKRPKKQKSTTRYIACGTGHSNLPRRNRNALHRKKKLCAHAAEGEFKNSDIWRIVEEPPICGVCPVGEWVIEPGTQQQI